MSLLVPESAGNLYVLLFYVENTSSSRQNSVKIRLTIPNEQQTNIHGLIVPFKGYKISVLYNQTSH